MASKPPAYGIIDAFVRTAGEYAKTGFVNRDALIPIEMMMQSIMTYTMFAYVMADAGITHVDNNYEEAPNYTSSYVIRYNAIEKVAKRVPVTRDSLTWPVAPVEFWPHTMVGLGNVRVLVTGFANELGEVGRKQPGTEAAEQTDALASALAQCIQRIIIYEQ